MRSPIIAARWLVLGLVLAWLSGCSALRLGYNQAPELAYWWLDGYVDFDGAQSDRVRAGLAQWQAWNRRTQLPEYALFLALARADVMEPTTAEKSCTRWNEALGRLDVAAEQAVPQIAELLPTLKATQLIHIEQRYAKSNDTFRSDFLQADPQERREKSLDRAVERAETLYGRLDDAQRDAVAKAVAASPFEAERWLSERIRRQQELLQLLRRFGPDATERDRDPALAQAAVRVYLQGLRVSPRDDYRRYAQRLAQFNCGFAASVHNATSAAQRQTARAKLAGWEGDLRALAAQTP